MHNWRGKTNKNGLYPIHLRIILSGESPRYYPIQVPRKVSTHEWSGQFNAWVSPTHLFYFEINQKIAETVTKLNELIKRYYTQNKPITFYAIDRELLRKGDKDIFNDYFRSYIDHPPETVTLDPVTWEKYEACLFHLNNFTPQIRFADVDEVLIARFRNYLAGLKGRKGNMDPATIKSYFDKLKVVLTHAAKKDRFLDERDVEAYFEDIKITVPKKKEGQHLVIEEIQRLRKLVFDKKDHSLERDRDLFLFQVYTGLYYNDLQCLRKDQLFKDIEYGYYIISERDKNGNTTIIPLFKFPYATTILEKYGDNSSDSLYLLDRQIFVETQVYNRNLKLLAKRINLHRSLSNKTGRHTNAQMWIRFGAKRPVLSKMMGHEKEETTESYYKVDILEVIEGTKSANFDQLAI